MQKKKHVAAASVIIVFVLLIGISYGAIQLRNRFSKLEYIVKNATSEIEELRAEIEQLQSDVEELQSEVEDLQSQR
jgi:peptidoglycan hydrolase CwlO-like protein